VHTDPGAVVAAIGQRGQTELRGRPVQAPRTCSRAAVRSWTEPGSTSETHSGSRSARTAPGCCRRARGFPGVPQVDGLAFHTDRLLAVAVAGEDLAVQDHVRRASSLARCRASCRSGPAGRGPRSPRRGSGRPWRGDAVVAANAVDRCPGGTSAGPAPACQKQVSALELERVPRRRRSAAAAGQGAGPVHGHVDCGTIGDHGSLLVRT